jgi:hypothetical protein
MAGTYVEERRGTVGVLLVCFHTPDGLHSTAEKAICIRWVTMLPVVPYLIKHL